MRQAQKTSRVARVLRRLFRNEVGGGDALSGIIMTAVGLLAVSSTLPSLRDAFNTAGDALKHQAGVLARGSDTGATGMGGAGNSGSGFDIGQATSALGQLGQIGSEFGQIGSEIGSKFGGQNNGGQNNGGQNNGTNGILGGTIKP
jgi:hypothetical protein